MSNVLLDKAVSNLDELVKNTKESGYTFENWLVDEAGVSPEEYSDVIDSNIGPLSFGDWGVAAAIGFQLGFDVAKAKIESEAQKEAEQA